MIFTQYKYISHKNNIQKKEKLHFIQVASGSPNKARERGEDERQSELPEFTEQTTTHNNNNAKINTISRHPINKYMEI